ncbi:hypothetical protein D3C79_371230 [compost metagenome]
MGNPLKSLNVCEQQLAAPEGAVIAKAGAIEGNPQHRACDVVLGHHSQQVGVMVLHLEMGCTLLLAIALGPLVAEIARVAIRDQQFRVEIVEIAKGGEGLLEVLLHRQAVQIADIGAVDALAAEGERQLVLLLRPDRQHWGADRLFQAGGAGGITPGEAQGLAPAAGPLYQAVVAGVQYGAIVIQDAVDLAAKFPDHRFALYEDRAAAAIGAGGHQRHGAGLQQQLVQRGVGQHHPQVGDTGGDGVGQRYCVG